MLLEQIDGDSGMTSTFSSTLYSFIHNFEVAHIPVHDKKKSGVPGKQSPPASCMRRPRWSSVDETHGGYQTVNWNGGKGIDHNVSERVTGREHHEIGQLMFNSAETLMYN